MKTKTKTEKEKEIKEKIKELKKELASFYIIRNPLLKKMRKDNWIVHVNNKAMICWAGIHTLDLLTDKLKLEN